MGPRMINPVRTELVEWLQASIGWAVIAARATRPGAPTPAVIIDQAQPATLAPLRLRATITIDIDACDLDEAERESEAIRGQFELIRRAHPCAELAFQRRKPRTGRRAPTPTVVVSPYVDD